MGHVIQRFGFRIGRGWMILLLIAAGLVAAAFWIGPLRPLPAELELLAVAGDTATRNISVEGVQAVDGSVRFPVPVAMRNVGARPARPARIAVSVPAQYRVLTWRGALPSEVSSGVPLRRYVIPVAGTTVAPGTATQRIPGLDTLWLEPELPSYYCILQGGAVPEFLPAPEYNAQLLSDVKIFYSFAAGSGDDRHTGLLNVRIDPAQLQSTPAELPPSFPTHFNEPQVQLPQLGEIGKAGSRTAYCGDPERPVELFTVQWRNAQGSRMYAIYTDAMLRKQIYDLNGDGVIELEAWDADGDGRLEARRAARYVVPEFLVPRPELEDARVRADSVPPDSAFLALFRNTAIGPWRFTPRVRAALAAERERALRDSVARDSARLAAAADSAARAPGAGAETGAPADPAWVQWFHNTAAGPFRFSRPIPRDIAPAPDSAPRRVTQPQPRAPLGTPVPNYPRPRPDTLRW